MKIRDLYRTKVKVIYIVLLIITFLCFMQMLIFSLVSFYDSRQNGIKLAENNLQQYVTECKNSIDEYFQYNFNTLEFLASYPEVYNMDWNQQYTFLKDKEEHLNFEHFIVIDLEGKGYYTNTNEIKNQSQEQFFSDVISNDIFLTEPFMKVYENKAIITLSVSLYNDGKKVGALCGVIDLSKIYKKFEDKIVGNDGYSFLINSNGNYIAHKNSSYVFNSNNFFDDLDDKQTDIQLLKEDIKNNNTNLEEIVLNDIDYYAVFSTLHYKNWEIVFIVPQSEFLIGLSNFTIEQLMTVVFGIVFIILLKRTISMGINNYKLAYTDSLTNINNRTAIDIMLKELENKYSSRITIICFDLNDFKYVNDTYGHNIGDQLLIRFSNMLNDTLGNIGFVGRMGGDEFIAILQNINILEIKYKIMELNELISIYNNKSIYKIKMSYGYAVRQAGDNSSLMNVYKEADKNMYEFKKRCKSKCMYWETN